MSKFQGLKVLVVEDEPMQAMTYCDILADLGAETLGPFSTAFAANEAIQTLPCVPFAWPSSLTAFETPHASRLSLGSSRQPLADIPCSAKDQESGASYVQATV